jgi:hypothetical protein
MKTRKNLVAKSFIWFFLIVFAIAGARELGEAVSPSKLPATVGIGTHPVGGGYYASGSAVAVLLSEKTKIRAVVQPFSGPNAWMPLLHTGKLELGLLTAGDAYFAYRGESGYDKPYTNLRLVLYGTRGRATTFTVMKHSGIKRIVELKGKRVASRYGGNQMNHFNSEAMLSSVGMSWGDVVPVPVTDYSTCLRLLQEGRIDAGTSGTTTTSAALELHNAVGLNVLAFGDMQPADIAKGVPPDKQAIIDQFCPGFSLSVAKAGEGIIEKDTVLLSFSIILAASAHLSEDAVFVILKTIWENYTDLHPTHVWLRDWKPDTMAADNQSVPYHSGAVKFYKEKGVWTSAMGKRQEDLLRLVKQ